MEFVEISAKTVDDAITKACIDLGTSSDNLEVQVVREGSTGFLGFGSKSALIKVRKKEVKEVEEVKVKESFREISKEIKEEIRETAILQERPEAVAAVKKEVKKLEEIPFSEDAISSESIHGFESEKRRDYRDKKSGRNDYHKKYDDRRKHGKSSSGRKDSKPLERKEYVIVPRSQEEIEKMKRAASEFLASVFKTIDLPVTIQAEYEEESGNLNVNFEGDDMGVLIGKRGQTLDSLQYLTSLVVNKDLETYIRVKLDTENYRKRRRDTLENLARNIASKVRKTRRPVSLEAMNPYERRIIHSALQGNKYVETYSEGNEPYRHVVVTLKRNYDHMD